MFICTDQRPKLGCCIRPICSYFCRAGQLCSRQGCRSHVQERSAQCSEGMFLFSTTCRRLPPTDSCVVYQAAIASNCLFLIANALSKCSVIFFMKRLFSTDNRTARILCNSLLALTAVWVLASILALSISCGPATKLALQDRCSGQVNLLF